MAAASAGALQSGSAVASSNVDQQVATVLQQQQQHQQQQQQYQQQQHQLQLNHHHQQQHLQHQLLHQQQIRPQHHNVQFQSAPQQPLHQQQQQRHSFIPRAGNGSQLRHNVAGSGAVGVGITEQQMPIISNNHHTLASNVAKQSNPILQCQPQTTVAANLAPGWRRLFSNNEIIYVSPSGASLRTLGQIKDYLLSPNTCKCGLPCPLRPEYFFDFNSQVPNMQLENGLPTRSALICTHQRRYFESQQNILHKEIKRRKVGDLSGTTGKISTSPVPQCNSVAVYSGNVMQTSQLMTNNPRMQMMAPQAVPNMPYHQSQQKQASTENNEKQIGSVTLSKTPPWRKNSILQQQSMPAAPIMQQIYAAGNERVPPLPQAHSQQSQQGPTPPWQHQQQDHVQNRFIKTRQSPSTSSKKKPNFKDDPTGYLEHQTAILHSSILNVVNSPDLNDGPHSMESNYSIKDETVEEEIATNKRDHPMSVIQQQQQNQILYPHNQLIENKQHDHQHHHQQLHAGIKKQQRQQPGQLAPPPPNFAYNQNHPRMIAPSQIGEKSIHQLHQHHQQQQQQQQPHHLPSQHQHVLANVPSSQPFLVDKHNQLIRNQQQQQFLTDHDHQQATTTTIGGQTVTHFPNGMVQVEQNCDNNMIPLKPQQQIQLQQQIQQHNMLYRQNQHMQKTIGKVINDFPATSSSTSSSSSSSSSSTSCHSSNSNEQKIGASQESPVSSSTTFNRSTPERRHIQDSKGPPQVGAISTSNESPIACPSPADSESTSSSIKSSSSPVIAPPPPTKSQQQQQGSIYGSSQTSARNTITSVQAGRTITATTTSSISDKSTLNTGQHHEPPTPTPPPPPPHHHHSTTTPHHNFHHQTQKLSPNNLIPVSSSLSGLQLQPVVREPGNQLIMTSTGQLIVMPTQANKSTNQVIINSPNGSNLVHQQSVVINQQGNVVNSVDVSNSTTNHLIQNSPNGLVIQNSGLVQPSANMIQSAGNLISNSSQNFIVNSSNSMQPMILNNSNLIQQNGQNLNLIQNANGGSSLITTGPNGTKVISSNGNILNQSNVIGNSANIISPNNGGLIGQQTVVLNTLPNGYMIQPNFTTVDGQVVGQIVNQDGGTTSFLQQQSRQIILTSPDSKRKGKKRKSSASSSPSTPSSLSPQQSPNIQQQQSSSLVQLTSQYPTQGFQISPAGLQGITMVNKNTQSAGPQQQIIFQNGQIIQPINFGQQLLVPAGLVVAPDTTLLQIQNIGPCGNIITPQGMVLRAQSPQNKNFLSPNGPGGQQFIVSGNSQMSPIGQIYGAPVSLVVPQSNSGAATFVQQNTTIVQQQTTMMGGNNNANNNHNDSTTSSTTTTAIQEHQSLNHGSASPPDTTTHSPRSPERPPSERSGGSDMVQCVSSSEPDSVVSPVAADSAQSPSTTDYDRSSSISYQTNSNVYKPSDAKIRRVQTPPQFNTSITQDTSNQMRPDSHESPTNSPAASSTSSTTSSSSSVKGGNLIGSASIGVGGGYGGIGQGQIIPPSFSIGQLVWGAARGHPAWPGKVVNPPGDGSCTPSDSTWVQWFGGRSNPELVAIVTLKSLSEGLEAHHKAQKDTRKSRKLNQQLERAIQEAMAELDRISVMAQPTSTTQNAPTTPGKGKSRGRQPASSLGHQRTKPIRIAPAPPCTSTAQHQIRQPVAQHQHHLQQNQTHQQQQQQQHQQQHPQHQQQHPQQTTQTK